MLYCALAAVENIPPNIDGATIDGVVGVVVGDMDGSNVGDVVGLIVGDVVGSTVGDTDGSNVGGSVGLTVGDTVITLYDDGLFIVSPTIK